MEIPLHEIAINTSLSEYGLTSLLIHKLNERLEKDFVDLPKTLFFQYKTINAFASYLIDQQSDSVLEVFAEKSVGEHTLQASNQPSQMVDDSLQDESNSAIAIIGMSGR